MKPIFCPGRSRAIFASCLALAALGFALAEGVGGELPPLSTVPGSPRLPGKFVWADLVTDDVSKATKFYGGMFGWTFQDQGGYLIAANDSRPVCGLFQRPRPADASAKPRWFGYLSVTSVEQAKKVVTRSGGKVLAEPKKMPKRGEQAVFADPEGALFGAVKSSAGDPPDFLAAPGDWIWMQMLSRDARKAADFYRQVAGYKVVENVEANRLSDFVLTSGGYARATVRTIQSDDKQVLPTWLPFVRVESVSDATAQALRLGGSVAIEPKPSLLNGKVAVIADPTGAVIGILEWSPDLVKGGGQR
jgi:predicted enzyme related to lactoylglutathione lyase